MLSVSLAAPAYNEAECIEKVVSTWVSQLRELPECRFEIVICNDGSTDRTRELLDALAASYPEVRPVHLARNRGAAVAMRTAIRSTTLDWVLILDSDGQYGLEPLSGMAELARRDALQAVHGVRSRKFSSPFSRIGSWISGQICQGIFRTRLADFNCTFNLIEGELARSLGLEARGLNYSTDITARLLECGARIGEFPVVQRSRQGGVSSLKLFRDASHRLLFVSYLGFRQMLFRLGVLEKRSVSEHHE